jgi:hypothetical protein
VARSLRKVTVGEKDELDVAAGVVILVALLL